MQDSQKQQVISAIRDLGRRVTAADVATKTGLPVLVVQQKLNQVASETSGHMQVGSAGDIVYSFSPGFSNEYLAKGIQAAIENASSKVLAVLFYLVRISFGIALVISLVLVVVLLIALALFMSRGGSGGSDDEGGDNIFGGLGNIGSGFHFSFWDWMILRDLLWWNMYSSPGTVQYRYDRPTIRKRSRSNFLLNCFSFLFGDGDPNEGLDEKRWQLIAHVIKRNNNVVTAEQLAPYTGADPKNEDSVLPVLVRFNGRPEVTETGNMIYVFESLQSVAAEQRHDPPAYLQEFKWKFTNTEEGELLPVYIVAGLNFGGAWYLWNLVQKLNLEAASSADIPSAHGFVGLVMAMVIYGTAFIAIPIVRAVINKVRNANIEKRNLERFRYSQMVATPTPELQKKLREADVYRLGDRQIGRQDVVYTTEKENLDQADDLSEAFKTIEERDELANKRKAKSSRPQTETTYNFSPSDDHDGKDDSRVVSEDDGGIIDLRKQNEKLKVPKKNNDFDANS